tara:strand:+ start:351 stop:863 length:513 start_codon:yes stop_codon:yes gene_type:complete
MILKCNSCEKKFVVPDQAITAAGRVVQCGSCGNKWKQYPVKNEVKKLTSLKKNNIKKSKKISKIPKFKKKEKKQNREFNLYSPEYLSKKHGITLKNVNYKNDAKVMKKASFGFYNSLILFIVMAIAFSKSLHFFQDFIVQKIPMSEFYLNYFFETIRNIFEIWKNLISNY